MLTITTMPRAFSSVICLTLAIWLGACGDKDDGPDTHQPPPPALDQADSALAAGVIIRVEVDDAGRDDSSTASLRMLASNPSNASTSEALAHAWSAGQPAPLANGDELDRVTSTQAWADYRQVSNYQTYSPTTYYGANLTNNYFYDSSQLSGPYRYYYYRRPHPQPGPTPNPFPNPIPNPPTNPAPDASTQLDAALKQALQQHQIRPLDDADFYTAPAIVADLGKRLFFDPILSGPGTTSCATCHAPDLGTSNALSLGPTLRAKNDQRRFFRTTDLLPRNSPSLYNRGHKSYKAMFWDSRLYADSSQSSGFSSPAGNLLPPGLDNALAAQVLFPLANRDEMLGCLGVGAPGISAAVRSEFDDIWGGVTQRVVNNPTYRSLLSAAYPGVKPEQISITHLANAIAAYESMTWRSDNSPFDRYIKGDSRALTNQQKQGAIYFYGKAACAGCHAGSLQTDQKHHAIALPQFGPGLGDGPSGRDDYGHARVTQSVADRYAFRTPSLRNVALSAPYGHNGAYSSLRGFIAHYINPGRALQVWDRTQITLPFRVTDNLLFLQHDDQAAREALATAAKLPGVMLNAQEIDAIEAFLHALTDPKFAQGARR